MPTKLKVVVGLMGVSILLALISTAWFSAILNSLLLFGVLKGSEGVRNILMVFAFLGLCGGVFMLVTGLALVSNGLLGIVTLAGGAFSFGQNAFLLWCLRQQDVQAWMFHRSSGGMA